MPPNFTIKSLVIVRRSLNITIAKNVLKVIEKNNQNIKNVKSIMIRGYVPLKFD